MNTRLLRKVAKHIAEEPKRLDMDVLSDIRPPKESGLNPPCGTVGCIAGWACMLTGTQRRRSWSSDFMWKKGAKILGLSKEQSNRLFRVPHDAIYHEVNKEYSMNPEDAHVWPLKFAKRYETAKTARGRLSATLARIEHFIKTKGKE